MTRILLLLSLAILVLGAAARAERCEGPQATLLAPVHVVDVEAGSLRRDRALVLARGRILQELAADAITSDTAPSAMRVDGRHAYVIPGLWDMHVHALWDARVPQPFLRMFLDHGVTAVRDMGGDLKIALATRAAIDTCRTAAPHLWFAGPILDGPSPVDPALSIALRTPDDGRRAVKMLRAQGVDFLKVYTLVPADAFAAVVDQAARERLSVAGHLPGGVKATDPAALRMASIEHLAVEIGGLCPIEDVTACGKVFDALVRARVAQTPTLFVRDVSTRMTKGDFQTPASFAILPEVVQSYWFAERKAAVARANEAWHASRALSLEHGRWMTRALAAHGGILLAGTDAGTAFVMPGESLHDELALLVEAGLSPHDALRAATVTPARFM